MKDELKGLETIDTSFFSNTDFSAFRQDMKQAEVDKGKKIIDIRRDLTDFTERIYKQPKQLVYQKYMGEERKLNPALLNIAKSFFVPPDFDTAESMFIEFMEDPDYGMISSQNNARYVGRYVYPVQGFYGEVIGMIGYDKEYEPKYLRSNTLGFNKELMFYGMHMMKMFYDKGYIIVNEGIVDTLWGWSIDEPFMGLCGDSLSEFVIRILERFGHFVLLVPDNDEAGHKAYNTKWKKRLPKASVLHIKDYKDIDDWRKGMLKQGVPNEEIELQLKNVIEQFKASASIRVPITLYL